VTFRRATPWMTLVVMVFVLASCGGHGSATVTAKTGAKAKVPLSEQASPCPNGLVTVKAGPPTELMTEPFDFAVTFQFVTSSSQECTVKGL